MKVSYTKNWKVTFHETTMNMSTLGHDYWLDAYDTGPNYSQIGSTEDGVKYKLLPKWWRYE